MAKYHIVIGYFDHVFKALADGTRRQILRALAQGDQSAGEIGKAFPMSGASVSHHLSILRNAGLVAVRRDGQSLIYSLNTTAMQEFMGWMLEHFESGDGKP